LYGAEHWTLRKADQIYLESFKMWCWRRLERISWTGRLRNKDVLLHRVKKKRNILQTIKKENANWIGHIWRRDCLEGSREYWKSKEEVLDRTIWRTRFGRCREPVVRQITEWMTRMVHVVFYGYDCPGFGAEWLGRNLAVSRTLLPAPLG
jgi:hypothetical protein